MRSSFTIKSWILLAGLFLAGFGPAVAGTMAVQWDPVSDSDLAGYHVYYGTTPGSHSQMVDAGKSTSTTLTNVTDCTVYYVTVRSYDTSGLESSTDSNNVKGYARPVVTSLSPNTIKQGETKSIVISGSNFDLGVAGDSTRPPARVKFGNAGLTVKSTTINACGQVTVSVAASTTATTGATWAAVENPDLSYSDPANHTWVFGQLDNALTVVTSSTDSTPPTVQSFTPAPSTTGVAQSFKPYATFSEPILASSVNSGNVVLLDANNAAVAQATGSPSTSGSVVTITPAAPLTLGMTYRIQVKAGGAKDLAGNAITMTNSEWPGWTVVTSNSDPVKVLASTPYPSATGVALTTRTSSILFNRDISVLFRTLTLTELQAAFKVTTNGTTPLRHASGSPVVSSDGKRVIITFVDALKASTTYQTWAGPLTQKGLDALNNAGIPPGDLKTGWHTNWSTGSTVQAAASRTAPIPGSSSPGTSSALTVPDSPTEMPASNTNLSIRSEFTLTFESKLAADRLGNGNVRLLASDGSEVRLASLPKLEGSGYTMVITPAAALEPGHRYQIVVRTGTAGIVLIQDDGTRTTINTSRPLIIPLTTEVSGQAQNSSLAVAP